MIHRILSDRILKDTGLGKVQVILGARQIGKTTLMESLNLDGCKTLVLNCDDADDRSLLTDRTTTELKNLLSGYDRVCIDEAQRVTDIGLTLKKIADLKMKTQVLVSGSSSLDLANGINEPATGRLLEYGMFPLSLRELALDTSEREEGRMLEQRLIYGLYPEVVTTPSESRRLLNSLANNYLFKDILSYRGLRKPDMVYKLVKALALQLGREVSYNELAQLLGIDKETVENYVSLLEKCFIVFRLDSFSRNLRNELKKGKKIYFWDNGIRNAVLSNFAPPDSRDDIGALWENLMVSERRKGNIYGDAFAQMYFWRTHGQQEIDLIEERDGRLSAFEFKARRGRTAKCPGMFSETYRNVSFQTITPENMWEFV